MARITLTFLLHLIFTFCYAQTGKLIVAVKGIELKKGGELSTGIFLAENFPKVGKQMLGNEVSITSNEMTIVFENVPVGTYGVVSFQDIDKNKQLKSNFLGFPIEPIGFSRDAKIKFGPPNFEDAKITVQKDKVLTVVINLK